jgi:hypothetical protein
VSPVQGHPYVYAGVQPAPDGSVQIDLYCQACGDRYRHRCMYLPKADAWIARYAAQHDHGAPGIRDRFFRQYDATLHQLRRQR